MLCNPAVTRMNVNPSPAQMLDAATAGSAVPESNSRPGRLITGKTSWIQPTFESTPTRGSSRNHHISLATATDVATVEEKIARNTPMPRTYLSASAASPTPSASPTGTVIERELDRHDHGVAELVAPHDTDVLVPPVGPAVVALGIAAHVPEPDRLDERIEHEHRDHDQRRREHQDRRRKVAPPCSPTKRPRRRPRHGRTVGEPTDRGAPEAVDSATWISRAQSRTTAPTAPTRLRPRPCRNPASAPATEPDLERIAGDLADIEQALDRLSDGSYWSDEITGETIPDEVLAEDPTARRSRTSATHGEPPTGP